MSSHSIAKMATARYYARILDEKVVSREEWSSQPLENASAIFFGCWIAAYLVKYATSIIEHILVNNFPRISRYLCHAEKGWKQCRLYWIQDSLQSALCVIVLVMRWPGWKLIHLHLWQCILYGILGYTVVEFCMVMALVGLQVYLWTGNYLTCWTGWDPLFVNEKREESMLNTGLEGSGQIYTDIDSNDVLREVTAWTKYPIINTPGSALKLRKQKAALEYARSQCHGEQRLRPSHPRPAPSTSPGDSVVANDVAAGVIDSNGSIFPEWMRGRSFRESIFGSSLASSQNRNSPCPSPGNVEVSTTAKGNKGKVVSRSGSGVPDLLTGSPIRSRKFL